MTARATGSAPQRRQKSGNVSPSRWENVTPSTASESYAWVNARQIWAVGTVNFETGKIRIEGFTQ